MLMKDLHKRPPDYKFSALNHSPTLLYLLSQLQDWRLISYHDVFFLIISFFFVFHYWYFNLRKTIVDAIGKGHGFYTTFSHRYIAHTVPEFVSTVKMNMPSPAWCLKRHIFKITKTSFPFDCLQACNDDVRCQSFNYVISQEICELSNLTKEAKPEDFVSSYGRYY